MQMQMMVKAASNCQLPHDNSSKRQLQLQMVARKEWETKCGRGTVVYFFGLFL